MNELYSAACTIANNFSKEDIGLVVNRDDITQYQEIRAWCFKHGLDLLIFNHEQIDYIFEWAYDMAWYHEYVF